MLSEGDRRRRELLEQLENVATHEQLREVLVPLRREHDEHRELVVGCPFCEGAIT